MPIAALIEEKVKAKEGVGFKLEGKTVTVTGPKGSLTRTFNIPQVDLSIRENTVIVACRNARKKDYALLGTVRGHIKNMIEGVTKGYQYDLKLVYSHFPVKMAAKGSEFLIENFVGEKSPRKAKILSDVKVQVKGDMVHVSGIDLEAVSQTAANIEQATRITGFDRRVFQDGIYLVNKGVS